MLVESNKLLDEILRDREFLAKTAQILANFHRELVDSGFTNDEAVQIVANYNFS